MDITDIDKYAKVITLGLDKRMAALRGGFVLDEFDPAVDCDKMFRNRLNRFVKRKNLNGLEEMLNDLIIYFEINYDQQFASVLLQTTGYTLQPIPPKFKSISTERNLRVGYSGKNETSLSFVSIELPTGSGSIYCMKGKNPLLTAKWLNNQTIEIQIPIIREEVERISVVKMYKESIQIIYKEIF